jgi:spermidine/putrescine transport system substrate-binding protein
MKWIIITILQFLLGWQIIACSDAPAMSLIADPTAAPAAPPARLNIFSQDQVIDPATLANFEAEFGVKVNYATATDHQTGLADIQAGLAQYDLVILDNILVASLRASGLFAPLNKDNIPNFKNIDPAFANPLFDPGNRYCVAYQWGTMGVGYNLQTTGPKAKNWADFFEANSQLRLGLPDDSRISLAAALLYMGHSPNTTNELEIAGARELLQRHSGQIITYAPGTGQALLADSQVDLIFARSGVILQLMETNPDINYVIPDEGSVIWIDSLCLLANSSHPELAETFINYILEPQVGATLVKATHYSSPNLAALPLLDPADLNNPMLYPDDDARQRLFFLVIVDPATTQIYNQIWADLMTSPNFQAPPKSN